MGGVRGSSDYREREKAMGNPKPFVPGRGGEGGFAVLRALLAVGAVGAVGAVQLAQRLQ